MRKAKVKMNKPIFLGLSILEISKLLMYEFWYDYMKPKYDNNVKLCYMDTDSFIMNIKTEDFYKDIANNVDKRFDTSNYEVDRPLRHDVYTENINTIALSSNDDKRLIGPDKITSYPYGYKGKNALV